MSVSLAANPGVKMKRAWGFKMLDGYMNILAITCDYDYSKITKGFVTFAYPQFLSLL